jgi:hypothetical protein
MDAEGDDGTTETGETTGRELATQVVIASLTGVASIASVYAGAGATAFAPVALAFALPAVKRIGQRRIENATEALMAGTDAASVSVEEFIDKAAADEHRHELFARALAVAQDAAWRNKRRALGRALAAGVMGDDARVDEEMLFIRAVDDLDEVHVRLLGHLTDGGRPTAGDIALTDPGLRYGLLALLGRLQSVGLIDSRAPVTPAGAMTPEPYYFITDLGRDFLVRLADETPTSSESKPAGQPD